MTTKKPQPSRPQQSQQRLSRRHLMLMTAAGATILAEPSQAGEYDFLAARMNYFEMFNALRSNCDRTHRLLGQTTVYELFGTNITYAAILNDALTNNRVDQVDRPLVEDLVTALRSESSEIYYRQFYTDAPIDWGTTQKRVDAVTQASVAGVKRFVQPHLAHFGDTVAQRTKSAKLLDGWKVTDSGVVYNVPGFIEMFRNETLLEAFTNTHIPGSQNEGYWKDYGLRGMMMADTIGWGFYAAPIVRMAAGTKEENKCMIYDAVNQRYECVSHQGNDCIKDQFGNPSPQTDWCSP